MEIVVTGAAGFLGGLVVRELLDRMDRGTAPLEASRIVCVDLAPTAIDDPRVRQVVGPLGQERVLDEAVTGQTVGIVHLAAVLSGGSEEDFDAAMAVNLDATRALLERARKVGCEPGACPTRLVFTSSLAVFGDDAPEVVPDHWAPKPASTYGALKAIGELLVSEYSRKGFVDARICRLPTISVRPGRPNSAASSFASGIIREPLHGLPSSCPVPHDTRMWLSSPRVAVHNIVHALELDAQRLPRWRVIDLPGISATVEQMLAVLARVGGPEARRLVQDVPDNRVAAIVCSWPGNFDVRTALRLGFRRDEDFDSVVRQYVSDHLQP